MCVCLTIMKYLNNEELDQSNVCNKVKKVSSIEGTGIKGEKQG